MSAAVAGVVVALLAAAGLVVSRCRSRRQPEPEPQAPTWAAAPTAELSPVGPVRTRWDGDDFLVHVVGERPVAAMSRVDGTQAWRVRDLAHPHRAPVTVGSREGAQAACWEVLDEVRGRRHW